MHIFLVDIWNKMVAILFKTSGNQNKMAAILFKTIENWNKMVDILFRFWLVWYWNCPKHNYNYCYDRPFQNWTNGNPNFKTFGIPYLGIQAPTILYLQKRVIAKDGLGVLNFINIISVTQRDVPLLTSLIMTWKKTVFIERHRKCSAIYKKIQIHFICIKE